MTKAPADCTTKEDVRAELDRIDQALLTLFAERHRYVTRMAEIKTDPHEAYDPTRISAILAKQLRDCLGRHTLTARRVAVYLHLLLTLNGALRPHTIIDA